MARTRQVSTVAVGGVWLRTTATGRIEVLIEVDDQWHLVIDSEGADNVSNISHQVDPGGMLASPLDHPATEDVATPKVAKET